MKVSGTMVLMSLAAALVVGLTGCSEGKLAVSCESFLEKSEEEQLDIARSFSSESLYRDDEPEEGAVVPGTQDNYEELVEYCSDPDNSDDKLDELEVDVGFAP